MPYRIPEYYKEIEDRFDKLEGRQREQREAMDSMQVNQGELLSKVGEIHTFLKGTEYDDNGGLCVMIKKLSADVRKNTLWRVRVTAAYTAVAGALGFLIVRFTDIWDKLTK